MALSNTHLVWITLGIWAVVVLVLLGALFFQKPTSLPSGNVALGAAVAGAGVSQ